MKQLLVASVEGQGLVGLFDPKGPDSARIGRFLPDGDGASGGPRVVLAGEIFNIAELAAELGLEQPAGPEAVLGEAYRRWSRDLLARLRGSFALALVDGAGSRALVAADQAGGHSIYYRADGGRLTFASEIDLLLKLLPTRPAPDRVSVVHWFSDYPPPLGLTLYDGIHELPGGECFELTAGGWSRSTYWVPRYEPPADLSADEAAALLWTALEQSVRRRLGTADHVGIVMSAGVDSSAVAAAAVSAARDSGSTVHGYSAVFPGYPDPRVDESARIDELVAALGLPSTQIRVEPGGSFALSLDWLERWQLPMAGPGPLIERPLLEQAAADGVDAVLDGQGGDEGFAVSGFWLADLLRSGRLVASVQAARRLPGIGSSWRDVWAEWRYYALHGALPLGVHSAYRRLRDPYRHAPRFLTPESARLHVETDEVWDWKRRRAPAWWAERAFLVTDDRQAIGLGSYLRRRAATLGLRARPPLLDPDLIDCLLRIPPSAGLDPALDRPLIRQAMEGRVPDSIRLSGLKSHLGAFFYDVVAGPDLEPIRRVLGLPQPELAAYVRMEAVRRLVDNPPRADDPGRLRWTIDVWRLATAECWLRFQQDASILETLRGSPLPEPRWTVHRTG